MFCTYARISLKTQPQPKRIKIDLPTPFHIQVADVPMVEDLLPNQFYVHSLYGIHVNRNFVEVYGTGTSSVPARHRYHGVGTCRITIKQYTIFPGLIPGTDQTSYRPALLSVQEHLRYLHTSPQPSFFNLAKTIKISAFTALVTHDFCPLNTILPHESFLYDAIVSNAATS
uniref:Uncharacterized protein n=1 Tax=Romanomermis culicivorax TaxID=13658 RepID=A0A915KJU5_ROMCU